MSKNNFKFGSSEIIKLIEIYRGHECLWDTENKNYKNREARDAALAAFSKEFGVEGFGPKEIMKKLKGIRTQYQAEKKKVKSSMGTGSGCADIYKPKLVWYNLMDGFLRKTSEARETTSNLIIQNDSASAIQEVTVIEVDNTESPEAVDYAENIEGIHVFDISSTPTVFKTPKKKSGTNSTTYIKSALEKLENIEKRAKLDDKGDDLDNFGKYVASTLRKFNTKNCTYAQDDIQKTLSKYKLQNEDDNNERQNSTPMPGSPFVTQNSEDQWWNVNLAVTPPRSVD